jgi:poly(A) polymerase
MIKKFIDRLLGKTSASLGRPNLGKRQEIGVEAHGIDPKLVDERAANVVKTLQQAGYQAYVVGGAVRDLLLGLRPKDFDVATDATPEQVKALFRRAFIIGRRFRIVHVVYGRGREHEVIEVSTFRAYMDAEASGQVQGNEKTGRAELAGMKHAVGASGRVLRDNVWGPQDEDAARRDFTVNAMYYDPQSEHVIDYHGGFKDSAKRVLRMIGDPATRYREDPVRIIRAIRFAAKLSALGFRIEPKTLAPLARSVKLLSEVPQSRLFDEMLKLLQTGHALATVAQLNLLGLSSGVYPLLDLVVERAAQPLVDAALQDTDRRVAEGKPVAPSFLLSCLLWSDLCSAWSARQANGQPAHPALHDAMDDVFDSRIADVSGRGKLAADMREIWAMQPRFERRLGQGPYGLVEQPRFRAGFDFMRLRAETGEIDEALADWWQRFSTADEVMRRDMLDQVREEQSFKAPPRRRTHAKSRLEDGADPAAGVPAPGRAGSEVQAPSSAPMAVAGPRRRRRGGRGRRPGGASLPPDAVLD